MTAQLALFDRPAPAPARAPAPALGPESIILRPLQERAVAEVRAALRRVPAVLLVAPTGFGKTATTAVLIQRCVAAGRRVLFLVHRREIVRATADRLRRAGVACGVVMADEPPPAGEPVLVCSVQTLYARRQRPPADFLFWDEAHHCVAKTYRAIAGGYPGARHVGLTATPERSDGTALGDCFAELVVAASTRELVAAGLLVPCDVVAPPGRLDGLAWDPVEAWRAHAAGRRTVVFAANVAHAERLAAAFAAAGAPAACVTGGTRARDRDAALARLAAGDLQVVVNVFCLTEGFDCPALEVCVLARGCGSAAMFLQCVGRALRTAPGKERALLLDLQGSVHEHGLPDEERTFALTGRPIRPANAKLPPLRMCPACAATARPGPRTCGRCGFAFPPPAAPRVVGGDLGRVRAVAGEGARLRAWRQLCALARARGYKPQWAAHRYRARFGGWPPPHFPRFAEAAA